MGVSECIKTKQNTKIICLKGIKHLIADLQTCSCEISSGVYARLCATHRAWLGYESRSYINTLYWICVLGVHNYYTCEIWVHKLDFLSV